MKFTHVLPVAFAGLGLAQSGGSLSDVLAANNDTLSVLGELLANYTDIADALSSANNITILAPSNDALTELLESSAVTEAEDLSGLVTALLTYHVLNGTYFSANITETPAFVPTLLTNETFSNVTDGQVVEVVLRGENVTIFSGLKKESNVTSADIEFDGGVIHVIDAVLTIPLNLTATAIEAGAAAAAGAITAADLGSALEEMEDITLFVPNNDAFAAIANLVGSLSTEDLTSILSYHLIEGEVLYSSDLSNTTVDSAEGGSLNITVTEDGDVYVNSARVVVPDVLIANGVVHLIDSVLNPNATSNSTEPNPETTVPAFEGASTATDGQVPFTSGVPEASETATNLATETSDDPAPKATAAIALGALFGGAAMLMNV